LHVFSHRVFVMRLTSKEEEKFIMDEKAFQVRFNDLLARINKLPEEQRDRLERLASETRDRRERIQQSVNELQESIDGLRLSVKYLVFDLEATRRENAYLRRLVEESNRRDQREHDAEDDGAQFGDEDC